MAYVQGWTLWTRINPRVLCLLSSITSPQTEPIIGRFACFLYELYLTNTLQEVGGAHAVLLFLLITRSRATRRTGL